jgi:Flp pilus assembly protein TadD
MEAAVPQPAEQEAPAPESALAATSFTATVYFKQALQLLNGGYFADAETYFREVLRLWPDDAGTLNNLGTAVWRQERLHEAEGYYRRAQARKPDDFAILNNLGNVLWEQGRLEDALRSYQEAGALKPDSAAVLRNLGVTLSDLGRFDEALVATRESLRLEPDYADSHVNLGMTFARQGNQEEALSCYERAVEIRPDFPEARRNRAYIYLARGDFERGWPEYEWRLRCPKLRTLTVDRPRWNGESLDGRSILLHSEQGLGDSLQFIRFARSLKARSCRVVAACPAPLIRLVARCPGVDSVVDWTSSLPDCDVQAPLLSLPAILGTTLATLPAQMPYFGLDSRTVNDWRPVVERAVGSGAHRRSPGRRSRARVFKIGIAWQGNRANTVDRWRSFPLSHFAHLATLPGVRLISLQKGEGTEQLANLGGEFPVAELSHPDHGGDDRRDFLDTAAVMTQLDLVVTPETAVAHLAGSLGVRVWVALSSVGDWRWMIDRDDSPWYPTMRLFRQDSFGDWDGVFQRMAQTLREELRNMLQLSR